MGTTLQHGIFLPAEGERNCYTGLASNWTILDGVVGGYGSHAANLTIHVTAADKEAWNGKADASALTAHTGNTTIHVTAADKEAWNGKANDSDVVHKSGNETVGGVKTFADAPVFTSFDGIRFRCAHNSNAYITFRNVNQVNPGSIIFSAHDGNVSTTIRLVDKTLIPYNTNDIDLGITSRKWKSFNGINPGALSLPDINNRVDITGYITDLTGANNLFTPTANGWICIRSGNATKIFIGDSGTNIGNSIVAPTAQYLTLMYPCTAGRGVNISINCTSLAFALFSPSLGNI